VPLPTSTLGLRNRRTIKPGTLVDGAVTQRLLAAVLAREPAFADRVLLADEQTYQHAGNELLAFLLRRYPADLVSAEVVPLAALPARTTAGHTVLDDLADRYFHGDRIALLAGYLRPLLEFQTTLLLRYGIALESHQQNVSLVLDTVAGRTRLRLLCKDNDGPRLRPDRVRDALGAALPADADPALLDDRRILVADTEPLIDLFTTITLHLCAGAIVFGLPEPDRRRGLRLIRELLAAAIERHPCDADAALVRAATLDAERLPVKAMVTAGTLLSKQRSGAVDVNKFYRRSGPNYLAGRFPHPHATHGSN
jgi:siderophore synthetase component